MDSNFVKYFGFSAISKSLRHFFIGKGFTIFSSLSIVFLLARFLNEKEYAYYITWQAIILVIGIITTAGIQAVMHRYLPELRSKNNNKLVYRMIVIGVFSRLILISFTVSILILLLPSLVSFLKQPGFEWLLSWYLGVGLLRLVSLSLAQAMESLLWQRISQYSLAIASAVKLFAILILIYIDKMTLGYLVAIEMFAEGFLFILLLFGLFRSWRVDKERDHGDTVWWESNKIRVLKYGSSKFLVNLSMLLYGNGPNRLLASNLMTSSDVAVLGFADSLIQLLRRFMPSALLIGMIRPIFIATYATSGDFDKLTKMSNMLFRINMLILIFAAAIAIVVGGPVFDWITGGKYGDANLLFAGFTILLIFEGLRLNLEFLIESVEKNQISMLANFVQSLSIFLAIPLLSLIGLWGLIVANMLGTLFSIFICVVRLNSFNFHFSLDKMLSLIIILYALIAGAAGWWTMQAYNSVFLSGFVITILYLVLCVIKPPFYKEELDKFFTLIKRRV